MPQCTTKRCVRCGVEKPLTEFYRNRQSKDGYQYRCAACHKLVANDYARRNRKKITQKGNEWRRRNRDRHLARRRANRDADRENTRYRFWYARNINAMRKRSRQWAKANPDIVNARIHRRRARLKGNGGSYTKAEWATLCAQFNHCCVCCGERKPLTVDHVVPISKGGSNDISNIQPLCFDCNMRKGTKIIDFRSAPYPFVQLRLFDEAA